MAYEKQNFSDGNPLYADQLNHIEQGVVDVERQIPQKTADAVADHNVSENAHNDIRLELQALATKLNNFLDSDDATLDELSELITAIKANTGTISQLTSGKVNVADIVNNLTTNVTNKPLSAAQGVALKKLIDALNTSLANYQPKGDYALKSEIPSVPVQSINGKTGAVKLSASDVGALPSTTKIPSKTSELTNDSGYLTESETRDIIDEFLGTGEDTVDIPITESGFMGGGSGWCELYSTGNGGKAKHSGYVEIPAGYTHVRANLSMGETGFAVLFSTGNGSGQITDTTVSVLGQKNQQIFDYYVEIPPNAKYVIVSTYTYSESNYAQFVNENASKEENNILDGTEFALFKQWGIVGDSLSVGHTADIDGTQSSPHYYYSWGQYLARRIGNMCLNIGRSGQSARSFMTDAQGYNLLIKPEMLCQCYILALGANDTEETLGSIADVDFSNMANNADTEYGWYAKVINAIRTTAPQAPIFCLTLPYPRNEGPKTQAINNMIRELTANENLSMVYLVDLDAEYDDYFKAGKLRNCIGNTGWHLTALGYLYASLVIEMAISGVMADNYADFQNVFKIPYGTTETTTTTEQWVFELEDGSTVTKAVVIA